MAKLNLVASSSESRPNRIAVVVTDADGRPVAGIPQTDFDVRGAIDGPGRAGIPIEVEPGPIEGAYVVTLKPVRDSFPGEHVFTVAVRRDADGTLTLVRAKIE